MSDHEFEKQVHQRMEELKLRPSDTVWMEVEKKIRQDKHRRRFLWLWVPMLLICLSTSAYILYHYSFNTQNNQAIARTPSLTTETATTQNTGNTQTTGNKSNTTDYTTNSTPSINKLQQEPETPVVTATTPVTASPDNNKQPAVVVKENATANTNNKTVQQQSASYTNNSIPEIGINTITRYGHEKPRYRKKKTGHDEYTLRSNENRVQQELTLSDPEAQPEPGAWSIAMPSLLNDGNNDIATSKAASSIFNNQSLHLLPDSLNANKPAALPIQRNKPSLWFWGITADAGYSRISENKLFQLKGLLGQDKYLAEDLSARSSSPSASSNSLINYTGSATTSAKVPSSIQPDFAFSAGIFIQRRLSPRLKISLGVEYTYMSVNTEVGRNVKDSVLVNMGRSSATVVPEYYKSAGSSSAQSAFYMDNTAMYNQKYRYRFQYIEVPLLINWQINKGRRLPPIVFDGGISISRLLSVDALHYEGIKGIYYKDNSLFNKTSINFRAGISVGLFQHSKHPIWIGPDLRYSLNGLVKKDVSKGQYLWSTGISIKMILGKL